MAAPAQAGLPTARLEELYRRMAVIRAFEIRCMALFGEKLIRGSVHPYVGQEAIAVGVCDALTEADLITSTHRGHGHCIAKGLDPKLMMAEITGRETGYCRGKGGSMHITAMRHGMLGADAIVGGSLAIAVGAAHGRRLQGADTVTVAFFGDGASNQGIFHEAANLASILKAPAIFVCENNQWAISMPFERAVAVPDIAIRAQGYGFPGVVVDGNDVLAVRAVAETAVERARAGEGPTLIEAKTFRVRPHSASTPRDSRPEELIRHWEERDPIQSLAAILQHEHGVDAAHLAEIDQAAEAEIEAAVEFAKASPAPDATQAVEDVYAPSDWQSAGRLS
jgi:acetoin:2,6-dichlorophenolindophenol oxidoreductase subunit alpha